MSQPLCQRDTLAPGTCGQEDLQGKGPLCLGASAKHQSLLSCLAGTGLSPLTPEHTWAQLLGLAAPGEPRWAAICSSLCAQHGRWAVPQFPLAVRHCPPSSWSLPHLPILGVANHRGSRGQAPAGLGSSSGAFGTAIPQAVRRRQLGFVLLGEQTGPRSSPRHPTWLKTPAASLRGPAAGPAPLGMPRGPGHSGGWGRVGLAPC